MQPSRNKPSRTKGQDEEQIKRAELKDAMRSKVLKCSGALHSTKRLHQGLELSVCRSGIPLTLRAQHARLNTTNSKATLANGLINIQSDRAHILLESEAVSGPPGWSHHCRAGVELDRALTRLTRLDPTNNAKRAAYLHKAVCLAGAECSRTRTHHWAGGRPSIRLIKQRIEQRL